MAHFTAFNTNCIIFRNVEIFKKEMIQRKKNCEGKIKNLFECYGIV